MTLSILPSVREIAGHAEVQEILREFSEIYRTRLVRRILSQFRDKLKAQPATWSSRADVSEAIVRDVCREARKLVTPFPQRVINGTGVILHTNLGRAPLGEAMNQVDLPALSRYCNLEWDALTQKRASRDDHICGLLRLLTGAESALAVNNCAGALLLALNTVGRNKKVLVSRSELVEIGGGFRIPEILECSGCELLEVGTTNRTRIQDYEKKVIAGRSVFLKVHQSNFVQRGFVESVSLNVLTQLGRRLRVPVIYDNGSGFLPEVVQNLEGGAGLVTFSADKLFGSVQAGIVVGKSAMVETMRKNPLYRALRLDKVRLALLHYTLREYLSGRAESLPVQRMTAAAFEHVQDKLRLPAKGARWVRLKAETGGGSNPESGFDSLGLKLVHAQYSAQQLKEMFVSRRTPILGYIQRGAFLLDVRTLFPDDLSEVQRALDEVW